MFASSRGELVCQPSCYLDFAVTDGGCLNSATDRFPADLPNSPRRGFTLVELLVVIAIIGILIALLLPAVQAARDAARKTQCADNLKNMALGCLNYATAKKTLPPGKVVAVTGTSAATNCGQPTINGVRSNYSNWALEILPFVEEISLFRSYHFEQPNIYTTNLPVIQTEVKLFECPSDPNPASLQIPEVTQTDPKTMTGSYKGVAGRGWYVANNPNEAYWDSFQAGMSGDHLTLADRGPLPVVVTAQPGTNQAPAMGTPPPCFMSALSKFPVKISLITDGTSKTLLIGEYTTITQPADGFSRSAFWGNSDFGLNLGDVTLPNTAACLSNPLTCNAAATTVTLDPDYDKCVNQTYPSFPQPCKRTFTGVHSGGVGINFAMCDGSVKTFLATVDIRILAALATIAGGESVQLP